MKEMYKNTLFWMGYSFYIFQWRTMMKVERFFKLEEQSHDETDAADAIQMTQAIGEEKTWNWAR